MKFLRQIIELEETPKDSTFDLSESHFQIKKNRNGLSIFSDLSQSEDGIYATPNRSETGLIPTRASFASAK